MPRDPDQPSVSGVRQGEERPAPVVRVPQPLRPAGGSWPQDWRRIAREVAPWLVVDYLPRGDQGTYPRPDNWCPPQEEVDESGVLHWDGHDWVIDPWGDS